MAKTTKKDFEFFNREASHWLARLNLMDYGVTFVHVGLEDSKCLAWTSVSLEDKVATIGLATDWDWLEPDSYHLSKSAFHECCELMLYKLHDKLTEFYSCGYVDEIRHEVIRTLESIIFDTYWNIKNKKK